MMNILTQLLTGKDNCTHDVARWLAVVSFLSGIGLSIYAVAWQHEPFNLEQYGIGVGALFTGFGIALKLKEGTEP